MRMNEQLTLRLVVSDFLDRYVSALDQNRLESWADLFAEDALYEIVSKENCDAGLPIPLVPDGHPNCPTYGRSNCSTLAAMT